MAAAQRCHPPVRHSLSGVSAVWWVSVSLCDCLRRAREGTSRELELLWLLLPGWCCLFLVIGGVFVQVADAEQFEESGGGDVVGVADA